MTLNEAKGDIVVIGKTVESATEAADALMDLWPAVWHADAETADTVSPDCADHIVLSDVHLNAEQLRRVSDALREGGTLWA